ISKPISPLELIVKATVFLLDKSRPQVPREQLRIPSQLSPAESDSANHHTDNVSGSQNQKIKQSNVESCTKKPNTLQETVNEKLKYLKEALAEETTRREAVEQQAAENAKRRTELEAAIEDNQRSQQYFGQLLEESQQQALAFEQGGNARQISMAGRRRALVEVRDFVADKLIRLKQALAKETECRGLVEQQADENAKRRTELEAAFGEIQKVQEAFQEALETADNPTLLLELESSLGESQRARETLETKLEAARHELEALRSSRAVRESELEGWTRQLQASQSQVEQKVQMLTE